MALKIAGMTMWMQDKADIAYLDELLMTPLHQRLLPKPVPASVLKDVPLAHLRQWCVERGVYQIVTEELISWLADQIKGRRAIEICAGYGTIGRALGIPMTDSYMQTRPEIIAHYQSMKQATISPPPDVVKMDANTAVRETAAEVIVGAWVTQRWIVGEDSGSVEGVDEGSMLDAGISYIHVGNDGTHGYKRLMKMPHDHHYYPWLISRAADQSVNHACVWPKRSGDASH